MYCVTGVFSSCSYSKIVTQNKTHINFVLCFLGKNLNKGKQDEETTAQISQKQPQKLYCPAQFIETFIQRQSLQKQ
jgi:hypothetical protein